MGIAGQTAASVGKRTLCKLAKRLCDDDDDEVPSKKKRKERKNREGDRQFYLDNAIDWTISISFNNNSVRDIHKVRAPFKRVE